MPSENASVNAVGYCLAAILLSALSAWLRARGETRLASTTYLATMVDFSDVGPVGVFIDEEGLPALESAIAARGYLSGQQVADTWRSVRANDLLWSFWGKRLPARPGAAGARPPVLELRPDEHARRDPHVRDAQPVRRQPAARSRRAHPRGRGDRRHPHHDTDLCSLDGGGPHRAVEDDLRDHAALRRAGGIRARRVGAHRRRGQSSREEEVRVSHGVKKFPIAGRMARRVARARRLVVAALGSLARTVRGRRSARPGARRRRTPGQRGLRRAAT